MSEMEDNDDVDVFEELGVNAPTPGVPAGDPLEAFLEEEDENGEEEIGELATEIVEIQVEEEGDDDEDPFVALGVSGPSVALSTDDSDDPLAALMAEDEDEDEDEHEDEAEVIDDSETQSENVNKDSIAAYKLVLETVWVDGILDPGEVNLLAKRREELGISFEKHLEMVREMIG